MYGPIANFDRQPVLIELMGHDRIAGYLTVEQEPSIYRIETPETDVAAAIFFLSLGAVFRITPCEEHVMKQIADRVNTYVFSYRDWNDYEAGIFLPARIHQENEVEPVAITDDDELPF